MKPHYTSPPSIRCFQCAIDWIQDGKEVVLATVIDTKGSAPQPTGGHMVIATGDHTEGSVSGGCVESDTILNAQDLLQGAPSPRTLHYSAKTRNEWGIGLPCGGKISIVLERIKSRQTPSGTLDIALLRKIVEAVTQRIPCALISHLETGQHFFYTAQTNLSFPLHITELLQKMFAQGLSGACRDETGKMWFIQSFIPSVRIIIVGAVHIAQELCTLCAFMGFFPIVIDPRKFLLTSERFPKLTPSQRLSQWPGEAIKGLSIDNRTVLITLSHDKKLDDEALREAVKAPFLFIGALGSQHTQRKRLKRLSSLGVSEAELSRIHSPVGLDIGSKGPQEIALSIMAQIIACLRDKPLGTKTHAPHTRLP